MSFLIRHLPVVAFYVCFCFWLLVLAARSYALTPGVLMSQVYAAKVTQSPNEIETEKKLLSGMITTMKMGNYQGRYVYFDQHELRSVALKYAYLSGVPHERILHLDGMHAEIIRIGDHLVCLHQGQAVNRFQQPGFAGDRSFPNISPRALAHYKISRAEPTRVAGYETVQLVLMPVDGYRYGYRFWIDESSHFLLKLAIGLAEQAPIEVFEFVDVKQNANLKADDFMFMQGRATEAAPVHLFQKNAMPDAIKTTSNIGFDWHLSKLPPGFVRREYDRPMRTLNAPAGILSMRTYSDGLASFTLFVSKPEDVAMKLPQTMQRGATLMISRPLKHQGLAGYYLTFVGELPLTGAQKVMNAVMVVETLESSDPITPSK